MSSLGNCLDFDHVTFWVSNAKQAASYYVSMLGFCPLAYKGLETGSRSVAAHAVSQGKIIFVFVSALLPDDDVMGKGLQRHGDFVKDIAFVVDDVNIMVERSQQIGANVIKCWTETDTGGSVKMATIATELGDTTHTFVQRGSWAGLFLPGFSKPIIKASVGSLLPTGLHFVDHCVSTAMEGTVDTSCDWYQQHLAFHRFWSVDDVVDVSTPDSGLKFLVVANGNESIKLNILEPVTGMRKSQVQEFNDYNSGPGIQHIALHTEDIISSKFSLIDDFLCLASQPAFFIQVYETCAHEVSSFWMYRTCTTASCANGCKLLHRT